MNSRKIQFICLIISLSLIGNIITPKANSISHESASSDTLSYAGNWIYIYCTYDILNESIAQNLQGSYVYHINQASTVYSIDRPTIVYGIQNGIKYAKGRPVIRENGKAKTNTNYYLYAYCTV